MQILHWHMWWSAPAATCAGGVFPMNTHIRTHIHKRDTDTLYGLPELYCIHSLTHSLTHPPTHIHTHTHTHYRANNEVFSLYCVAIGTFLMISCMCKHKRTSCGVSHHFLKLAICQSVSMHVVLLYRSRYIMSHTGAQCCRRCHVITLSHYEYISGICTKSGHADNGVTSLTTVSL